MMYSYSIQNGEIIAEKIPAPKIIRNKGKNLLALPDSYTVIDIETTGLSPAYDQIIEISAVKYRGKQLSDNFTSLLKPDDFEVDEEFGYLPAFITELTGITDGMLENAPNSKEVLRSFLDFIGDDILVGHNVNFDINFLYDNIKAGFDVELSNDFIDTMRISRRVNAELPHHRLADLADFFNLDYAGAHRAFKDCQITNECYLHLFDKIIAEYGSEDGFIKFCNQKKNYTVRASDMQINSNANPFSPVFGKVFVFTGKLERMVRKEAMQLVANLGGQLGDNVTKKTNYLVLGNNDYCTTLKGGKSSKQRKAEKLKSEGVDIEIIPEDVFYEMISEEF